MKISIALALALAGALSSSTAAAQDRLLLENVGPQRAAILVDDGVIAFTGAPADLPDTSGASVIDAGGLYAVPGLIDMHVHVWGEAELAAYLAHGVTSVRNLSGMPFHLRMAEAIAGGDMVGPRLFTSGPILNSPGPNAQINHQMVLTEEEGRAAVRAQAAAGFVRIKTYSNLSADAWRGVRSEAQALGMRITGHTPEGERLDGIPYRRPFLIPFAAVLDTGFETIEHVESIYFHALSDRWDEAGAEALVAALHDAGVPVTPTLIAQRNLVRVAESDGAYAQREGTEWLNPVTQQLEAEAIAFWAGQDPAAETARAGHYARMTAMLQQAGVLLVAGSDAGIFTNVPGASLVDELDLLVEAGLSASEALAAATANAARALGEEGRLGCAQAGCLADLVFTTCDPAADIACLRDPAAIMRAGRWIDADGLAQLRARAGRHDVQQVAADLAEGMAAQGTPLDPALLGM